MLSEMSPYSDAYDRGREAGENAKDDDSNPFDVLMDPKAYSDWLEGWQDGRDYHDARAEWEA